MDADELGKVGFSYIDAVQTLDQTILATDDTRAGHVGIVGRIPPGVVFPAADRRPQTANR